MLMRTLKPLLPDGYPAHGLFRTTIFVKYILSDLDDWTDWALKEFVFVEECWFTELR